MEESKVDQQQPPRDEMNRYQQLAIGLISQHRPDTPFQLKVISDSMWPLLRPGDLINVQPSHGSILKRGDIIVYVVKNSQDGLGKEDWIVHRLVGKHDQDWLLKGDNRRTFDPPIPNSDILGRVIQINHKQNWTDLRRFPWNWLNRWLGFSHFGYGILFTHLRRLWGRLKSSRGKK